MEFRLTILLILFLASSVSSAATPNPVAEEEFNAGLRNFRAQQYEQALEHFTRAESVGMRDARLDYNLGAVFYRLQQYGRSRQYFEKLLDHPTLGAAGYYNLGLISHRQGDSDGAIAWFEKCAEVSQDQDLADLARRQIAKLGGGGPREKSWFAYTSAIYGYDSNITLLPSSDAAGESGGFLQALALGEWKPGADGDEGLYLTWLLIATDFLDSNDFDDDLLLLGAEYRLQTGGWQLGYAAEVGKSTFAGEAYTDTAALAVNGRRALGEEREVRLRLTLEDVTEGSSEFAYIDGSRAEFGTSYRIEVGRREYRFEYGFEVNDRENTDTESFSPSRHRVRLRYFDRVTERAEIGASIEFRDSDYKGVAGDARRDKRRRLRLEGKYEWNRTWSTQAEITYTDNDSSEPGSSFHKHQALVSINALF